MAKAAAKKTSTVSAEHAARFAALFRGLDGVRGTHGEPELDENGVKWTIKKTARTLREQITGQHVLDHLEGRVPLGAVPIRADSTCAWGSIDVDDYDVDVPRVIKEIETRKLPLLPCRSKSGGLHLFVFLSSPAPAEDVQTALRDVAASTGFGASEIFPKQTRVLADKGDMGSWMILPYYGDDYGKRLRMQHGVKRTGAEMTLREFLDAAEALRVAPSALTALRAQRNRALNGGKGKARSPFSDGPPCLQHMAAGDGIPQGGQNNSAFHMGVYYKRRYPEDWQKHLEKANAEFMRPPLPADNLAGVIRSLEKKDYEYKCKDQPMVNFCDSRLCRTRKFGVGAGGEYPEIQLRKLDTEPAVWFVTVEGQRLMLTTRELQNYVEFHRHCMEYANRTYRMIPQQVWLTIVSDAMRDMDDPIPAPEDIGIGGRFRDLLEQFLTNRMRGLKRDDILSGRPWEDEERGRHYFQLAPLQRHLEREGLKGLSLADIGERIRRLSGSDMQMPIKGSNRRVWWIPSSAVQHAPPAADTPAVKGGDV